MMGIQSVLPEPLTVAGCDLRDFSYLPIDVVRLRDSSLATVASGDGFRAAVLLWCVSWHQVPAGSLRNDDAELAHLAGYGRARREWAKVRSEALRGFVECSDGRLYHPVVADKANEAWKAKLRQRWMTECARIKKQAQRGGEDLRAPDFETWMREGCPGGAAFDALSRVVAQGTSGFDAVPGPGIVPRDKEAMSHGQRPGHGLQGIEKGKGNIKKDNQPTSQPVPDLTFRAVCETAGFAPARRKLGSEAAIVAGWLDGWDGCDLERDVFDAIRSVLGERDGATASLARFSAAVMDRRARAVLAAGKGLAKRVVHDGESRDALAVRKAAERVLGAAAVRSWLDPCRVEVIGKRLVIQAPSKFHADYLGTSYATQLTGLAGTEQLEILEGVAC
jgi:hypothetical protein